MKNWLTNILISASRIFFTTFLVGGLVLAAGSVDFVAAVETSYLYTLSDFSGPVPYNWARIFADKANDEIYVVDRRGRDIRIFDKNGMEIYHFGDDGSLGTVIDVVVKEDGDIVALSKLGSKSEIILCNYRGERLSKLTLRKLPAEFINFAPDRIAYRKGRLYLMDSRAMRLAVTDESGLFQKGYDIFALLEEKDKNEDKEDKNEDKKEGKKREDTGIGGFSVDHEGNMLFTVPALFFACTLSPDGKLIAFGEAGGAPGKFNIAGGIVADDMGNFYVADRLKSAVLIFDRNFKFLKEFGYRGSKPDNFIGPNNLAIDSKGRLYVSQLRKRGISVFEIIYP